ncbi:hypothetical protein P256_01688 [Acinetobacter nectaris CIP 110549]|uniref:Uncharacterized protein n=1 Tax=Acinetobacter nectaris CIP 110549 TaxID=1392540 RepID=V2UU66_9GAMM|nr:hypothetical protein P256_01688 [Acinetobacter nectaris CIP 110549]
MEISQLTRRVKQIRYSGIFIAIVLISLILLNFKTNGFNRATMKDNGEWYWCGAFYFLMSTHYLKYLKGKYPSTNILSRPIENGITLSIVFAVLMLVSIWIKKPF